MIIQSTRVWNAGTFMPLQLELAEGKITGIYPHNTKEADRDYGDRRIVPGFIEMHAHGAYGFDTNDAHPEGLRDWVRKLPLEGVTTILPTTVTQSEEVLLKALQNVAHVVETGYEGAEIYGVHFEGPYLNIRFKGAQPEEYIANPNLAQFKSYQEAAKGIIKYMTLAPEKDENFELTQYASQHGVAVSIGHSGATYEQAMWAIANGACCFTHAFNGMSPLNQREPGCVGALMRSDAYSEIIADGRHVKPSIIYSLFQAKGKDRMVMVTDSLSAKGNPPGRYELGGNEFIIDEYGTAILLKTNGLAGSTLFSNRGLRVLAEEAQLPFEWAINALTKNPADLLKIDHRKGKLVVGYDADLVVLEDNYDVLQTYCLGREMK